MIPMKEKEVTKIWGKNYKLDKKAPSGLFHYESGAEHVTGITWGAHERIPLDLFVFPGSFYFIPTQAHRNTIGIIIYKRDVRTCKFEETTTAKSILEIHLKNGRVLTLGYATEEHGQIDEVLAYFEVENIRRIEEKEAALSKFYQEIIEIAPSAQAEGNLKLGKILLSLGIIFATVVIFYALYDLFFNDEADWRFLGFLGRVALALVPLLIFWGQRHKILNFNEVAGRNRQAPILFLRSFTDDFHWNYFYTLDPSLHDEACLSKVLNDYGLFIAIGKPGERLPNVGAYRKYVNDEDWEEVVKKTMSFSKAVVYKINSTDGLLRELQLGMELMPPEKLLFYIPEKILKSPRKFIEEFREKTLPIFPKPFPVDAQPNSFYTISQAGDFIKMPSGNICNRKELEKTILKPFLERL